MYCLKIDIPEDICKIDDELKAIYLAVIQFAYGYLRQKDRNNFMDETKGMMKADRKTIIIDYA